MIEVAHLYRSYGSVMAVEDLSFQLQKGEVVGFLGPNGAGKTTTMRILAGFLPATRADRINVAGFDVLRESIEVRKRIGYLPESVPLYRELRVKEMLRFHGRLHGMSRGDLRTAIPEVLNRVGVLDRSAQLVGNLSRGLKQRVGLAVALLPNPEVLILDEPTSGLDPIQRREVRGLIGELAKEHTVLLSSHILAEIEMVCPRVVILDRGRLLADGSQEDLLNQLAGEQRILVEAAMPMEGEDARRMLAALPGVTAVELGERLGIHYRFTLTGDGDLREDVGALAMQKGWALRELSMTHATLEEVFAKLVLGEMSQEEGMRTLPKATGTSPQTNPVQQAPGLGSEPANPLQQIQLSSLSAKPTEASKTPIVEPKDAEGPSKQIYSLNPFDRGASRDLSKPVTQEDVPPVEPEGGPS